MDQVTPAPFSVHDFRARVAAQAEIVPDDDFGDHRFNPGHPRLKHIKPLRDAAVLIPVVDRPEGAMVLLTKRAEKLRSHSGQVAFPVEPSTRPIPARKPRLCARPSKRLG